MKRMQIKNKAFIIQKQALFSYTRAFCDRPRHLEPWSSDEDDTSAGTPLLLTTPPVEELLSSQQIPTRDTSLLP
ncbi:hypothetical protein TNCV_4862401 [Trichonephila clavipes]|nr:hypothetical protein TNCV_4862401 [Trichonephila clavipes]